MPVYHHGIDEQSESKIRQAVLSLMKSSMSMNLRKIELNLITHSRKTDKKFEYLDDLSSKVTNKNNKFDDDFM